MSEQIVTAEVWIPLTQGKVAVIDFDDFEKVRGIKWYPSNGRGHTWYVSGKVRLAGKRVTRSLHRFLMDAAPGEMVDHWDLDGLNNRRSNLRLVTRAQNQQNRRRQSGSSRFKGVRKHRANKWRAEINANKVRIYLGVFDCEEDAARAYDAAATKHHGEYARINFPAQKENQCQSSINSGGAL